MLAPGTGSFNNVKTMKATTVLNAGEPVYKCSAVFKVPILSTLSGKNGGTKGKINPFKFIALANHHSFYSCSCKQILCFHWCHKIFSCDSKKVLAVIDDYSSLQCILKEVF